MLNQNLIVLLGVQIPVKCKRVVNYDIHPQFKSEKTEPVKNNSPYWLIKITYQTKYQNEIQ